MLTKTQLSNLRELLERAQNPIFLYDNDADGLCSYVLLRRLLGRGKGMAVRTHPEIDVGYLHKAQSLGADLVVVLDCPFLGDAFVEEIVKLALPLVWIDHHRVNSPHYTHPHIHVFNPALSKRASAEPVTYWCYRLGEREEDIWIALMGCISDHYLPDFSLIFARAWPDFWKKGITKPFEAYYETELGRLARALGFGLKDSVSHVVYLQNFLIGCLSPQALLEELASSSSFAQKYEDIHQRYVALLAKAPSISNEHLVFYHYGGSLSISADLANELLHRFPSKYIMVVYTNAGICTMSLRGKEIKQILEQLLPSFVGASGGGHDDAVGARIRTEDLSRFKEALENALSKRL